MEETGKKRSFYIALGAIIVCAFTVAVIYKNMKYTNEQQELAEIEKQQDSSNAAKKQMPDQNKMVADNSARNNDANNSLRAEETDTDKDAADTDGSKSEKKSKKKDKKKDDSKEDSETGSTDEPETVTTMGGNHAGSIFNEEAGLNWPVQGDILMKYSMDKSIYFKTLAQYKCNPALIIESKPGSEVQACAKCIVTDITENEETGLTVTTALDDKYKVIYGQLKDVTASVGDELAEGDVIGKIAKPTKYYVTEGSNLYLQVTENDKPVDPLLLLR